ncbi:MAG: universal stress protein [Actinobacteria bacterium]|nr:universal stress protein [Actinomycetota bacterium]
MEKIVVAVSGVAGSHPAIDWALAYAAHRDASVELVHVVDTTWGHAPVDYIETALLRAEEHLRDRADAARRTAPGTPVTSHVHFGSPVNELVASARGAALLVVGAHPEGRYSGAGAGAVRLARLAPCSVVIVPVADVVPAGHGVVVGTDGSEASLPAVEFAAQLADRYHEDLTAVYAWGHPEPWGLTEPVLVDTEPVEEDRMVVAESLAGISSRYPDLVVHVEISGSRPEVALPAAATGARMLVVGAHGRSALSRALLGSVSESVVAELPCTVAVIRAAE